MLLLNTSHPSLESVCLVAILKDGMQVYGSICSCDPVATGLQGHPASFVGYVNNQVVPE
jgi:hypothetical protein